MGKNAEYLSIYKHQKEPIGIGIVPTTANIATLRRVIAHQMYVSGRGILIHEESADKLYAITPYQLEEARQLSERQRKRFVDGIMDRVCRSNFIVIRDFLA